MTRSSYKVIYIFIYISIYILYISVYKTNLGKMGENCTYLGKSSQYFHELLVQVGGAYSDT